MPLINYSGLHEAKSTLGLSFLATIFSLPRRLGPDEQGHRRYGFQHTATGVRSNRRAPARYPRQVSICPSFAHQEHCAYQLSS